MPPPLQTSLINLASSNVQRVLNKITGARADLVKKERDESTQTRDELKAEVCDLHHQNLLGCSMAAESGLLVACSQFATC